MSYRIHPLIWPALVPLSPLLAAMLVKKGKAFDAERPRAALENEKMMHQANELDLPELEYLKLTAVIDALTAEGFAGEPGVSYLVETDRGRVLFDVGLTGKTFAHNWRRLDLSWDGIDAVAISHLHLDHMGGMTAMNKRQVMIPAELAPQEKIDCFVPDTCDSPFFTTRLVEKPQLLPAGLGTTGPLACMLFFRGYMVEQSLVANVKGKGLVVIIGCGHPRLDAILPMAQKVCSAPLHAVVGGLHFPVTNSRSRRMGLDMQRIFGTGKRWNDPINDDDLSRAIRLLQEAAPKRLLISPHDSCDHALKRFEKEVDAEFAAVEAGRTYEF